MKATEPTPPKGQEEALAIQAFAWFIELLEKANFRHVYSNVVPLLYYDQDRSALAGQARTKRLELNGRSCAGSMLPIFRFLGFPAAALKFHMSKNPDEHPPLVCRLYGITQPFSVADLKQQWDAAKAT